MQQITKRIVRDITTEMMREVLIDPPVMPRMTENRKNAWKRQAKRILESELFQFAFKSVVNGSAQKILRDADSDVLRGKVIGLAELHAYLNTWMATASNVQDTTTYAEDAKRMVSGEED